MNPPRRRRTSPAMLIAAVIAVAITTFWESRSKEPARTAPERVERTAPAPSSPPPSAVPGAPRATVSPRLDGVAETAEEREALLETLALIERNGPFPHPGKDGSTFANRERRLPKKPRGYYREYTVPTRGAPNRGARRVVTGSEGERWYTRDHYRTFIRIDGAPPVR